MKKIILFFYKLDITNILIIAFSLCLLFSLPLLYLFSNADLKIFSSASTDLLPTEAPAKSIIPESYSTLAPRISDVDKFYAASGDTVTILGSNFSKDHFNKSKIFLNNKQIPYSDIVFWSDSEIDIKVHSMGLSKVSIIVNNKRNVWDGILNVFDKTEIDNKNVLTISENNKTLLYPDSSDTLFIYGMSDFKVLGTKNYQFKNSLSNYIEILDTNNKRLNFKVINSDL